MTRVAIDLVPMEAGQGGTGSGIWTYAENLLRHLDQCMLPDMEIVVFTRRPQIEYLKPQIKTLKFLPIAWPCKGIVPRLLWVHVLLPLLCWCHRVTVLHKLATETPLCCLARRVTTIHDFYHEFLWKRGLSKQGSWSEKLAAVYFFCISRLALHRSAQVVTVSEAVREEVVERFPNVGDKITVIHHGVATIGGASGDALKPRLPISDFQFASHAAQFTILYPAKFMPYKGQMEAIAAFEKLLADHPELSNRARLIFRGYSNDRQYDHLLRERVRMSPACSQLGFADYERNVTVGEVYRGAHCVLLLSQYEGFGLPVIEAQAMGLPVICSDLPVLREVANTAALFVDPSKPEQVANALFNVISNSDVRQGLQVSGRRNAERFSWKQTALQTLNVYRAAVNGSSGA